MRADVGETDFGDEFPVRQPPPEVRIGKDHGEHAREPGRGRLQHVRRASRVRRRREEHAGLPQTRRVVHRRVSPGGRGGVPSRGGRHGAGEEGVRRATRSGRAAR
eukprot:29123-Pelagococcus_subviridis.AAC.6